jgi:hypothetical protein
MSLHLGGLMRLLRWGGCVGTLIFCSLIGRGRAEEQTYANRLKPIANPQPPVYPSTIEVSYVAALKKADVDALVVRLEKEIDQLQDRLDQFNHVHKIEVDGRILELAS